ncbi:hypothetical protein TIFTF001_033428 [Ficus carica]|uniref:Uncharacterized protein n=1 Tax=Ficus carica TaxID=3494 RepID=A0AA88DY74_FICCA|nr:hypothetical protein TIFTF001_033428 [Ficus carica]
MLHVRRYSPREWEREKQKHPGHGGLHVLVPFPSTHLRGRLLRQLQRRLRPLMVRVLRLPRHRGRRRHRHRGPSPTTLTLSHQQTIAVHFSCQACAAVCFRQLLIAV